MGHHQQGDSKDPMIGHWESSYFISTNNADVFSYGTGRIQLLSLSPTLQGLEWRINLGTAFPYSLLFWPTGVWDNVHSHLLFVNKATASFGDMGRRYGNWLVKAAFCWRVQEGAGGAERAGEGGLNGNQMQSDTPCYPPSHPISIPQTPVGT